jgi:hypothetical protein
MELEALADLCYRRSTPEDSSEWRRHIESGWTRSIDA